MNIGSEETRQPVVQEGEQTNKAWGQTRGPCHPTETEYGNLTDHWVAHPVQM